MIDVCFITHLNSENRVKLFVQTFESFIKNTNFSLIDSIVLMDDCSPVPITVEIPQLKYIRNETQKGVGFSKNLGAEQGTAKYIYFSDTDVFFTPKWADKLLEAYSLIKSFDNVFDLGILAGGCHPYLQTNQTLVSNPYVYHIKDAVSGWSWLLERETWNKYGKLHDHALGSGQSEDWEYCQRIKPLVSASIFPEVIYHCGITNTENMPVGGAELFPRLEGILYL